ncbi:hypothetical protein [Dyella sp. A6]|uniref:hypothetical protein n=1 Tax=Dyella aluminiiresistens TaxID=3069105 RepID=UPI002E76C9B2|nr:hypothetical protein [Dyella sp. A6]
MSRNLLKTLVFAGLLTVSAGSVAQGYYEFIPYYGNDPFLFCTFGVPSDCWYPINPATGSFGIISQYCFNPVSAAQYARVCPHAFMSVVLSMRHDLPHHHSFRSAMYASIDPLRRRDVQGLRQVLSAAE